MDSQVWLYVNCLKRVLTDVLEGNEFLLWTKGDWICIQTFLMRPMLLSKQTVPCSFFAKNHIHNHHYNNLCQHRIWPTKKRSYLHFSPKNSKQHLHPDISWHLPLLSLVVLTRHHCRSLLKSCATKCRPGRRHLIAGEVMRLGGSAIEAWVPHLTYPQE